MELKKFKPSVISFLKDIPFYLIGVSLFSVSVNCFTAPNNIAPGGLTGIATVINYLTDFPIGMATLIMNIPLLIWAFISLGYKFIGKTLVGSILCSAAIDLFAQMGIPEYSGDHLLAAIFGGILSGAGLGLIFLSGATTGGTDILAKLISKYLRQFSIGKIVLFLDAVVVIIAMIVYRNIESALYAVITVYASSVMIDTILYGSDSGKVIFIVSNHPDIVSKNVIERISRGVTVLNGQGAFTGSDRKVLMCAVRRNEVFRIRDILHEVDPSAFIIIGDATQILGEGFKDISDEN